MRKLEVAYATPPKNLAERRGVARSALYRLCITRESAPVTLLTRGAKEGESGRPIDVSCDISPGGWFDGANHG